MSVIHAPESRPVTFRHLLVPAVLLVAMTAFIMRLWYWQVVKTDEYKEMANRTGKVSATILAPRGRIVDRNGKLLASVEPRLVVTAKPSEVLKHPEVLDQVAEILQVDVKKLKRAVNNQRGQGNLDVPIYVGSTLPKAAQILEDRSKFPGIDVDTQPMRVYTDKTDFSHILGWVDIPTEKIEKKLEDAGIKPARYVGRDGVEMVYEKDLMGTPGTREFAVDKRNQPIRSVDASSPVPGRGLALTVDKDLQVMAAQMLGGRKGAVVALEPSTGEILCMVSEPSFDLSMFEGGLSTEEADYLWQNKDRPMYKRAIAGMYPPGSTSKIVTTIAAAMSGTFHPSETVFCPGYLQVGNRRVRCENHAPGSMDFNWAFTKSCNSYFGHMAQEAGADAIRKAMHACGYGEPTDIDVNGSTNGVVPTNDSILKNHGRRWSLGDTNNVGIGQGDLLVTPLQMADIAAMVANRGTIYRPHVVKAFMEPMTGGVTPVQPEVLRQVDVDGVVWDDLQKAMKSVVAEGTARAAQIPGVTMAGKTGSAENAKDPTHAWFIGYAPAENPQIAWAVIVENGGHGGDASAPIAKAIVEKYLEKKDGMKFSGQVALNR